MCPKEIRIDKYVWYSIQTKELFLNCDKYLLTLLLYFDVVNPLCSEIYLSLLEREF